MLNTCLRQFTLFHQTLVLQLQTEGALVKPAKLDVEQAFDDVLLRWMERFGRPPAFSPPTPDFPCRASDISKGALRDLTAVCPLPIFEVAVVSGFDLTKGPKDGPTKAPTAYCEVLLRDSVSQKILIKARTATVKSFNPQWAHQLCVWSNELVVLVQLQGDRWKALELVLMLFHHRPVKQDVRLGSRTVRLTELPQMSSVPIRIALDPLFVVKNELAPDTESNISEKSPPNYRSSSLTF
jgi:hypothetical protein